MTLTSSLLITAWPLSWGLMNFIAPDYFFNPKDGVLSFASFVKKGSAHDARIDSINRIECMAFGVQLLTMSLMQIFVTNDSTTKKALLHLKFYMHVLILSLCIYTATGNGMVVDEDSMLDPKITYFWIGTHFTICLTLVTDMIRYGAKSKRPTLYIRNPATFSHLTLIAIQLLYLGTFVAIKLFYPGTLGPNGVLPFFFTPVSPDYDNTAHGFDEFGLFLSHLEGIYFAAYCLSLLELLMNDRTVERIRWQNQYYALSTTLYTVLFLRGAFEESTILNRPMFAAFGILDFIGGIGSILWLGPGLFKLSVPTKTKVPVPGKHVVEPTLVDEKETANRASTSKKID